MKENIHPKYFKTTATCACGATYEIGSTKENIRVDICSKCHPIFTGMAKLLDTEGRVERFKKKYAKAAEAVKIRKEEALKRRKEKEEKEKKEEEAKALEIKKKPKKSAKGAAPAGGQGSTSGGKSKK